MAHFKTTHSIAMADGQKQYAALRATIKKAGLLNRSYRYYAVLFGISLVGFFTSIYFIIITESIFPLILWGLVFSFFTIQIAGLMHDAGHRAICKTTKMNDVLGYICAGLVAMGYSSWKIKHNLHHAHTNEEDGDPDVDLPLLSFTTEQHQARKGIVRVLSKYQMYLYYPIGTLINFGVRITSFRYLLKNFKMKNIVELIWYSIALVTMFVLPFFVFDFTKALTLFIVVNASSGFYLLNVFAPNHKGMPILKKGQKISFLEQQVMTSRNIIGNFFTDYIYMGLNYQIEHHLFPDCPRNKLKSVSEYIKKLCSSMKLEYTEVGIIETNRIILAELRNVARES